MCNFLGARSEYQLHMIYGGVNPNIYFPLELNPVRLEHVSLVFCYEIHVPILIGPIPTETEPKSNPLFFLLKTKYNGNI